MASNEHKVFLADFGHGMVRTNVHWPYRPQKNVNRPAEPHIDFEIMQPGTLDGADNGVAWIPPMTVSLNMRRNLKALHAHLTEVLEYIEAEQAKTELREES